MTREVRTARRCQPLYDLVEAFSDGGLHPHAGGGRDKLVGIITQSDMVAALFTLATTRNGERGLRQLEPRAGRERPVLFRVCSRRSPMRPSARPRCPAIRSRVPA